jgi:hypothetical protein
MSSINGGRPVCRAESQPVIPAQNGLWFVDRVAGLPLRCRYLTWDNDGLARNVWDLYILDWMVRIEIRGRETLNG